MTLYNDSNISEPTSVSVQPIPVFEYPTCPLVIGAQGGNTSLALYHEISIKEEHIERQVWYFLATDGKVSRLNLTPL